MTARGSMTSAITVKLCPICKAYHGIAGELRPFKGKALAWATNVGGITCQPWGCSKCGYVATFAEPKRVREATHDYQEDP